MSSGIGFDEEDALNVEKVEEQKRLKELGLERARRAEEERIKRCVCARSRRMRVCETVKK